MNLSNPYCRLSNYKDLFSNNSVIYIYSKNKDKLTFQNILLKQFCKEHKINPIKMYVDSGCKNNLDSKYSLKRLLEENTNTDVIIFSQDRLSRKMEDIFKIHDICKEKNIGIYDYQNETFLFEENDYIQSIKNIFKDKSKVVDQCKDI